MPERETPGQAAERELLAVREEVQQLAENMRARLADDERAASKDMPDDEHGQSRRRDGES